MVGGSGGALLRAWAGLAVRRGRGCGGQKGEGFDIDEASLGSACKNVEDGTESATEEMGLEMENAEAMRAGAFDGEKSKQQAVASEHSREPKAALGVGAWEPIEVAHVAPDVCPREHRGRWS